jgi:hypothetical protein
MICARCQAVMVERTQVSGESLREWQPTLESSSLAVPISISCHSIFASAVLLGIGHVF